MITAVLASLLGFLYFFMSLKVIQLRRKHKISYGYGPNNEIIGPVSAHSNFAAYVPVLLILLYIVETSGGFPFWLLLIFAGMIFFGRVFHYHGVFAEKTNFKTRVWGMMLTLFVLLFLSLSNIFWVLLFAFK